MFSASYCYYNCIKNSLEDKLDFDNNKKLENRIL